MFGGQLDLVHPYTTKAMLCNKHSESIHVSSQQLHLDGEYLRKKIEVGEIMVDYVPTHEQKVNIFIKPLGCKHFFELTKCLGIDYYF
jgi:hypothetical protein